MTATHWERHLDALRGALEEFAPAAAKADGWGRDLGARLASGARVLVAGNGGSAAQAQHFTAELVGRYRTDRRPVSAIALHADASSTTAISNDYSPEVVFARQVDAHARPGDVVLLLSTSGRSPNVVAAANAARALRVTAWALTGRLPNPLADACDDALAVAADPTATVQEVHLVALHLVCDAAERVLLDEERAEVAT